MCYIYASVNFSLGRMAELADAYALGAYGVTHKSSTLFSPTKLATDLVQFTSVDLGKINKLVAGHVALLKKCCIVERVCIGKRQLLGHLLDLGFSHQTHTYPLLHILQQYQHTFFKKQMYAQVGRFCNKCNKFHFMWDFLMQQIHWCVRNLIRNRTL